jgi:hypothetical protein
MPFFLEKLRIPGRWRRMRQVLARLLSAFWRHKRLSAVLGILLILSLLAWNHHRSLPEKATYYVAYVGRYQSTELDPLQEKLLNKYMGSLAAVMQGAKLELKTYNIRKSEDRYDSRDAYQDIASEPKILAVVDNTWGENLASVINTIVNYHIPVVSMNADRQGKNYNNQVAFIGYDDGVPGKVIAFARTILNNQRTVIVVEDKNGFPSSGQFLSDQFFKKFPGVTPLTVRDSVARPEEMDRLRMGLQKELRGSLPPRARQTVILNTHSAWGNAIIDFINDNYKNTDLLGGPYITNRKLADITVKNENRLIIFTRSRDAVTNRVHQEAESIGKMNEGLAQSANTELYLERCLHAVAVLEEAISQIPKPARRGQKYTREQFSTAFQHLKDRSFIRNDELFKFSKDLLLDDSRTFDQHSDKGVSSYPKQLNSDNGEISNIHVGVDDVQISSIDTGSRTFHANFNYWLNYQGAPADASKYLVFRNLKVGEDKQLVTESLGEAGVRQLFRMSGDFEMNVDLSRFPFDQQEATIQVEPVYPRQQMHVSFDHDHFNHPIDEFKSNEWSKKESYVSVDNVIAQSLEKNEYQNYETLNIRTIVKRNGWGPWFTIILPMGMIGLAGIAMLYLHETSFSHVGNVCVVLLLAIATSRITFPQIVQNSVSWTVADKFFFGTFVVVFLVFLKVIIMSSGIVTENAQVWMKSRSVLIGNVTLIVYCAMAVLAVKGWDIRLWNAFWALLK